MPLQKKQKAQEAVPVEAEKSQSKKERKYTAADAEKMLPQIELRIREQEAMKKVLEMQMNNPANQMDLGKSQTMAAEHEAYENKIAELMEKWELLMEALEE